MRLYTDSEVEWLIDEISEAALEAIEQATGEAAKAASLALLEREAVLLQAKAEAMREASIRQAEALRWQIQAETNAIVITEAKKAGIKNAIIAGAVCLLGGLAVGIGGTLIIGGR
jgi:hypothetical protein